MHTEPTKLAMFLTEVQKNGVSETSTSVHSVTVRMPSITFTTVEALARVSGMARNKVIVNLLDVAIDEMWKGLDAETRDVVASLQGIVLSELMHDDKGNIKHLDQAKKGEV